MDKFTQLQTIIVAHFCYNFRNSASLRFGHCESLSEVLINKHVGRSITKQLYRPWRFDVGMLCWRADLETAQLRYGVYFEALNAILAIRFKNAGHNSKPCVRLKWRQRHEIYSKI